jgi:cytochrome oxidase Cu insertion factor (SCO1/SenC/PrrC family)
VRKALLTLLLATISLSAAIAGPQGGDKKADPPPPKIKVGDMAPDFILTDQNGNKVKLSDFRGKKNVALGFYVFAFTGG